VTFHNNPFGVYRKPSAFEVVSTIGAILLIIGALAGFGWALWQLLQAYIFFSIQNSGVNIPGF